MKDQGMYDASMRAQYGLYRVPQGLARNISSSSHKGFHRDL